MQMDDSRLADRVAAQAGRDFPGPGPGCGLERERADRPFLASGRIAAWRAGRAESERADGPFSASGRITAWRAERSLRERAVGLFSYLGRISIVNSNLLQFIFCSEII
jgi:hypothetical protein